ncbi:hypothetical protein BDY24DRAFT_382557 [Mrakia frigida]|uniref:proteasome assembly chaperone 4 family protein n=1 Tax=Mrakia frigida TaxID=29902 RepID=UPI003FCC04D9
MSSAFLLAAIDPSPSSPHFLLHVTQLTKSYLLWVGTCTSEGRPTTVRLGADWACGMPALGSVGKTPTRAPVGTTLCRTGSADLALSMSTRLAKRFSSQIFLSLDLPSSLTTSSGPASLAANPNAQRILVDMEMKIVAVLKKLEAAGEVVVEGVEGLKLGEESEKVDA